MRVSKTLIIGLAGFVGGVAFILACGTDSMLDAPHADGATACDCPTPTPIESRIQYVKVTAPLMSTETEKEVVAACAVNARLIGGFCSTTTSSLPLVQSGPNANFADIPGAFVCDWDNRAGASVGDFTATAVCLTASPPDAGH